MNLSCIVFATGLAALGGCGEERVDSIEKVGDDGSLVQGTKTPTDPDKKPAPGSCGSTAKASCSDLEDGGFHIGFNCDTQEVFTLVSTGSDFLTCQDVNDTCDAYAAAHPGASVACLYSNEWIYRKELSPGACEATTLPGGACADTCEVGSYRAEGCGTDEFGLILTRDIPCGEALENCVINVLANPEANIQCWFNGKPLYEREITPGACSAFP